MTLGFRIHLGLLWVFLNISYMLIFRTVLFFCPASVFRQQACKLQTDNEKYVYNAYNIYITVWRTWPANVTQQSADRN